MHVAVLGAGVIGITTAYFLREAGHTVTIIDQEDSVAQGCSFANGGQLSYSYTDAMASPSFLAKTPLLLAGVDPAIRVRPPLNREMLQWGQRFLRECTSARARANTLSNLKLAMRSRHLLNEIQRALDASFAFRKAGKIVLLRSETERRNAEANCELKSEQGIDCRVVDLDEAISIEPAILTMTGSYTGAVYAQGDDVGDAQLFTTSVADKLSGRPGCTFRMGTTVTGIVAERHRVYAVETDSGALDVDSVVVCLGASSQKILRPLGVESGIIPARGYSVTLPPGERPVSVSVTDFAKRFVVSRLNDHIRIAGFADFVGHRTNSDQRRVNALLEVARTNAPDAADYSASSIRSWGGFRPLTANGLPRIGPTTVSGLYLNTGHGSLGWTLACASAEKVVALITPNVASGRSLAA